MDSLVDCCYPSCRGEASMCTYAINTKARCRRSKPAFRNLPWQVFDRKWGAGEAQKQKGATQHPVFGRHSRLVHPNPLVKTCFLNLLHQSHRRSLRQAGAWSPPAPTRPEQKRSAGGGVASWKLELHGANLLPVVYQKTRQATSAQQCLDHLHRGARSELACVAHPVWKAYLA